MRETRLPVSFFVVSAARPPLLDTVAVATLPDGRRIWESLPDRNRQAPESIEGYVGGIADLEASPFADHYFMCRVERVVGIAAEASGPDAGAAPLEMVVPRAALREGDKPLRGAAALVPHRFAGR